METINVAVIGHTGRGNYGHGLDTVWRHLPQCRIAAAADAEEMGRIAAGRRLGTTAVYADWRKMLDEVKPQIVAICPRWLDQHHDMVVGAAERGVHIYMEKPLCRTLAEADAMVRAVERNGVKLAIAFQTRYSPRLMRVRQMIEEGAIGKVLELRGRGKEDARGGGEDLWVLGTHIMNMMHHLCGEPRWCFAEVLQQGRPATGADVVQGNEGIGLLTGDAVHAMYGMDDGVTAYFGSQRKQGGSPSRFGLQILGSSGIIEITTGFLPETHYLPDASWSPGRSQKQWQPVSSAGPNQPEPIELAPGQSAADAGNLEAVRDLLCAIQEDRHPEANIYEARTSVDMIAAVFESQRQQTKVSCPLENRNNPLAQLK